MRTRELLNGLARSFEARGIDADTYLAADRPARPSSSSERLRAEARQSVARELVLEAVADKLGIAGRPTTRSASSCASSRRDATRTSRRSSREGGADRVRDDLRLRKALDRVAAEVKPIPPELAEARESIWTPEKEQAAETPKLWTPGSKE